MKYKEFRDEYSFLYKEWVNADGKYHREDGPACTKYYGNNSIWYEEFYINGVPHREDGPSDIIYYSNGILRSESFSIAGLYHREDGPADISYDEDGSIIYESYYLTGKCFGTGEHGFWNFWEAISEKQRQNLNLLKYLLRHM